MIDGVITNKPNNTKRIKRLTLQVSNQKNQGTCIMIK